uniref:Uncharacterized protein n=1 Tax=Oryza meridionalis TaxID=40149 RepID=A0A0E0E745_9ORYZ
MLLILMGGGMQMGEREKGRGRLWGKQSLTRRWAETRGGGANGVAAWRIDSIQLNCGQARARGMSDTTSRTQHNLMRKLELVREKGHVSVEVVVAYNTLFSQPLS